MTAIKLRDYQREAIDAVFKAWDHDTRAPAIVLPTGAGKTVVFSSLVERWRRCRDRYRRVIVLAHRDELVDQAIDKLRAMLPEGVSVGKVKAKDREVHADVMVCSVQTLVTARSMDQLRSGELSWGRIGLIITDECHHAAAASYQYVYDSFPNALRLGVTATMARGDGVGLGKVWDEVVYSKSILWMISKGYLTDVRTKRIDLKALDMASVASSRGDWQAGDLGRALLDAEADTAIVRAYKEHADGRRAIVFTPTVETAFAAFAAFQKAGIPAEPISGETPRDTRQRVYESFRKGGTSVLVSCMVLTEGFDAPWAEVAIIARPTQSAPLYTQMVGRVLRPYPGKTEALILDLVGASANRISTLVDLAPGDVVSMRDGESLAEAVVREAEEANQKVPAGSLAFELRVRDVDAFAASSHVWGRTRAGVLFISCGDTYVFLWPSRDVPGAWDVCVAKKGEKWQRTPYVGLSIGEAMAWGEAVSEDWADFSVQRSARWRQERPGDRQVNYARLLGIDPAGMRKGSLSEAIDRVLASEYFDTYVKG